MPQTFKLTNSLKNNILAAGSLCRKEKGHRGTFLVCHSNDTPKTSPCVPLTTPYRSSRLAINWAARMSSRELRLAAIRAMPRSDSCIRLKARRAAVRAGSIPFCL